MPPKNYRHWIASTELFCFIVSVKETDLYIRATSNLRRKARRIILKHRHSLESYIERNPGFLTALKPLAASDNAPEIVRQMAAAAAAAGVGPMAAVAGAIAEFVGKELLPDSPEIIIENGGDIFLRSLQPRTVGIYAGTSPLSGKVGLQLDGGEEPLGICTSSGTVGHSLSFGRADAAVIISPSAILADAVATAVGNTVQQPADIPAAIRLASSIRGVTGAVIIQGKDIGVWGEVRLCRTEVISSGATPPG